MPSSSDRVSRSVRELRLSNDLSKQFHRDLDRLLRHRTDAVRRIQADLSGVISELRFGGASPGEIVERLHSAVSLHAEERGFRGMSVLSGVPTHQFAATQVARWAAEMLGVSAPPPATVPSGASALGATTWHRHYQRALRRNGGSAAAG